MDNNYVMAAVLAELRDRCGTWLSESYLHGNSVEVCYSVGPNRVTWTSMYLDGSRLTAKSMGSPPVGGPAKCVVDLNDRDFMDQVCRVVRRSPSENHFFNR